MSKVDGNLIQSILWYAIAAIWALIAIARWLSGEPDGSDAMTLTSASPSSWRTSSSFGRRWVKLEKSSLLLI